MIEGGIYRLKKYFNSHHDIGDYYVLTRVAIEYGETVYKFRNLRNKVIALHVCDQPYEQFMEPVE